MANPEALHDDHVLQMIELLGPLPDNLKQAWSNYGQYFDEHDVQTSFRNEWTPEMDFMFSNTPSVHGEDDVNENDASNAGEGVDVEGPLQGPHQSPFPAHLVPSVVEIYEPAGFLHNDDGIDDGDSDTYVPDIPLKGRFMRDKHPNMSQGEAEVARELLDQILRYDPTERPSTTDLLRHPWIVEFCQTKCNSAAKEIPSPRKAPQKRRKLTDTLEE
ncbi:hypothetical protein DV736_g5110, partial [Chaetothyriales sp. CBS 134916]